jgi:hypothetical protein
LKAVEKGDVGSKRVRESNGPNEQAKIKYTHSGDA